MVKIFQFPLRIVDVARSVGPAGNADKQQSVPMTKVGCATCISNVDISRTQKVTISSNAKSRDGKSDLNSTDTNLAPQKLASKTRNC